MLAHWIDVIVRIELY